MEEECQLIVDELLDRQPVPSVADGVAVWHFINLLTKLPRMPTFPARRLAPCH